MSRIIQMIGRYVWPQRNGQGRPDSGTARGSKGREVLAALRKKESKQVANLVREIEKDYQFNLGLLVIKSLIESANVSIEVEGDDNAQRLADNLQAKFDEILPHAMKAFGHGRAVFEKTYEIDSKAKLAILNDLDYLPFDKTEMVVDNSGGFGGVKVKGKSDIVLEPSRVWWFALDPTPLEPHGRSRYLGAAYEVWKQRNKLARNEETWLDRFALGHGKGFAPNEYGQAPTHDKGDIGELNRSGEPRDPMEDLQEAIEDVRSGGTVIMSSARDENGNRLFDYEPTITQPQAAPLENKRKELDTAALRSLGIPERAITQDAAVGSLAMAQIHMQMLFSTVEGILSQMLASYQQFVIDKCVAINWPAGSRPILTIVYQPLRESARNQQITEIVMTVIKGTTVSPLIAEGVVDFTKLLEIADLPVGDNVEKRLAFIRDQIRKQQRAEVIGEIGKAVREEKEAPTPGVIGET